jgi:2-methylcitrate dehydratase PrpD
LLINLLITLCALRFEDLSKEVVHEVKRRVIDSLGCALGAWKEEPFVIARRVAADFSAKHGSTIFGTDHKAPPDWAAFANGCGIRYFDFNDTYLSKEPAHPSDNISAALAVRGKRGRWWTRIDHRHRACIRSASAGYATRRAFVRAAGTT